MASREISAGIILVARFGGEGKALLIRVRKEGYEVPKGHVEGAESLEAAALRELSEETAIISPVTVGPAVGVLDYSFQFDGHSVHKQVHYFLGLEQDAGTLQFGPRPKRTRELRWVTVAELLSLPLVTEALRAVISCALESEASA